ncbi:MAG TPA: hypothetical protein VMV24_02720 [Candidatus Dormibacteraeota bacterium]|nr:hypothetical protein [Candidatus Dormibacteraeota bacterium]
MSKKIFIAFTSDMISAAEEHNQEPFEVSLGSLALDLEEPVEISEEIWE